MLRRPMSFILSRLNSITRRYMPLPHEDSDDSQDDENDSLFSRIHQHLRDKLGSLLPVVVFLCMLSILIFLAIITDAKDSPFHNLNDALLNYNYSQAATHMNYYNGSKIIDIYHPSNRLHGPTGVYNGTLIGKHTSEGAEIGILTIAFFTLMATWAVVQLLRIMRIYSNPGATRREIALSQILNSTERSTLWFDGDFQRRLRMTLMRRDFTGNDFELLQELDEEMNNSAANPRGSGRGARQEFIDRLPSHVVSHDENRPENEELRTCSICLGPFEEGETLRTLFCLHQFHQNCVDNWLRHNASCPICKASILE